MQLFYNYELANTNRGHASDDKEVNELMLIVDFHITYYEKETLWKYYQYEMEFLTALKAAIENL